MFESSTKTEYVLARAVEYGGTALFFGGLAFVALISSLVCPILRAWTPRSGGARW